MPSARRIRVVLAIDPNMVMSGVQQALTRATSIEIVAEARDVATALTAAKEQAANVVLLSCPLGGEPAAALAAQVQAAGLTPCLLVLAAPDDEACLRAMLASGVTGYVVHTELGRALVTAIRTLAQGQPYFSPEIRLRLVEWAAQAVAAPCELDRLRLTEREQAILNGLAQAWDEARIAVAVGLAERTVRYHTQKLKERLGVETRTALAVWAVDHGLGRET